MLAVDTTNTPHQGSSGKSAGTIRRQHQSGIAPEAAAYTVAKTRFSLVSLIVETAVLLGFTLFGGLEKLSDWVLGISGNDMIYQIALIALASIIVGAIDLPFDYWQQFVLEEKFGFNKMTPPMFVGDIVKSAILGVIIGLPVIWVLLTVMGKAGTWCGCMHGYSGPFSSI